MVATEKFNDKNTKKKKRGRVSGVHSGHLQKQIQCLANLQTSQD